MCCVELRGAVDAWSLFLQLKEKRSQDNMLRPTANSTLAVDGLVAFIQLKEKRS